MLHGLYQIIEILTRSTFAHKTFQVLFTFGLVCFAWLFFKADSISEAVQILKSIITLGGITKEEAWIFKDGSLGLDDKDFWMMTHTLLILLVVEFVGRKHDLLAAFNKQPIWFRWAVYYMLFFSITIFGFYGEANAVDFVYFQF